MDDSIDLTAFYSEGKIQPDEQPFPDVNPDVNQDIVLQVQNFLDFKIRFSNFLIY